MVSLLVTLSEMFSQFFGNAFSSEEELSDELEIPKECAPASSSHPHETHGEALEVIPPAFKQKLVSKVVREGESAQFEARISGSPLLQVTWYHIGHPVVTQDRYQIVQTRDSSRLIINSVDRLDAGPVKISAVNDGGEAICIADLLVVPSSPSRSRANQHALSHSLLYESAEVTTTQAKTMSSLKQSSLGPGHQTPMRAPPFFTRTLRPITVNVGENIILDCCVQAHPPPLIRWLHNGSDLTGINDGRFQITFSHDGACTLFIRHMELSDAGQYICHAQNQMGKRQTTAFVVVTEALTLGTLLPKQQFIQSTDRLVSQDPRQSSQIGMKPKFLSPLRSSQLVRGNTAYFESGQVSGVPFPTIVWSTEGKTLSNSGKYIITINPSSSVQSLLVVDVNDSDEGEYTCTAINQFGEDSTTAYLLPPDKYTEWLRQEKKRRPSVTRGLSPSPRHSPVPEYQTKKLRTRPASAERSSSDRDQFSLEREEYGSRGLPPMAHSFRPQSAPPGPRRSQLPRSADNSHMQDYPISDVDISFRDGGDSPQLEYFGGFDTPEPTLMETEENSGIAVRDAPRFVQSLASVRCAEGDQVQLRARISGYPKPRITWLKNGSRLQSPTSRLQLLYDGEWIVLRIRMALQEDSGNYTILAENGAGQQSCSATLTVDTSFRQRHGKSSSQPNILDTVIHHRVQSATRGYTPHRDLESSAGNLGPQFISAPPDKIVKEGQLVRFDCRVSGRPYPEISWFHNGRSICDDFTHKIIVNESGEHSLMITHADMTDTGQYTCVAKNYSAETSIEFSLIVEETDKLMAPTFVQRFRNTCVLEGSTVEFFSRAVGIPQPIISWLKGAREIMPDYKGVQITTKSGASTLIMTSVIPSDSDWYVCTARNSAGVASAKAKLTVEPKPRLIHATSSTANYVSSIRETYKRRYSPEPISESVESIALKHVSKHPRSSSAAGYFNPSEPVQPVPKSLPRITVQLASVQCEEGQRAHFECVANTAGEADLAVEWFKDGSPLRLSPRHRVYDNFGMYCLDILAVEEAFDSGVYTCRIVNAVGDAATSSTLTCHPRLKVVGTPTGLQRSSLRPVIREPLNKFYNTALDESVDIHVTIDAVDEQSFSFQWIHDGQPVLPDDRVRIEYNAGRVTLRINQVQNQDSGIWVIKVVNRFGETCSGTWLRVRQESRMETYTQQFSQELFQPSLPTFLVQPQETIYEDENSTLFIEFRVKPESAMVQFLRNGQLIEDSSHIKTVTGQGHGILEINVAGREDSGSYTCRASTPLGFTDTTFHVNVREIEQTYRFSMPTIQIAPVDSVVQEGTTARFYCTITGVPRPRVSWRVNGQQVISGERFKLTGDNWTSSLEMLHTRQYDSGEVTAVAENSEGSATARARLIVTSRMEEVPPPPSANTAPPLPPQAPPPIKSALKKSLSQKSFHTPDQQPVFTQRLQPCRMPSGKPAIFTCEYYSHSTVRVDWYREDRKIEMSSDFQIATTESSTTLFIPQAFVEDSGNFTVRLTNEYGTSESMATLVIEENQRPLTGSFSPPSFLEGLRDVRVRGGQLARFEAKVIGSEHTTVTWLKNGRPLPDNTRINVFRIGDQCRLLIRNASPIDSGMYQCIISSESGESRSEAFLNVEGTSEFPSSPPKELASIELAKTSPPKVLKPPSDTSAFVGEAVTLRCTMDGSPKPEMRWYKGPHLVRNSKYYKTFVTDNVCTLVIRQVLLEDEGEYRCVGKNPHGEAEDSAYIRVLDVPSEGVRLVREKLGEAPVDIGENIPFVAPDIEVPLMSVTNSYNGEEVTLSCTVKPCLPHPSFAFYHNDQIIHPAGDFKVAAGKWTYSMTIKEAYPDDSGTYTCVAWNEFGLVKSSTQLNVSEASRPVLSPPEPQSDYRLVEQTYAVESSSNIMQETIRRVRRNLPVFTQALPETMKITEGQSVEFLASTASDLPVTYDWQLDGRQIRHSPDYQIQSGPQGSVLTVVSASSLDMGQFRVIAKTDLGQQASEVDLHVRRAFDTNRIVKPASPTFEVYDTTYEEERSENIMKETVRRIRPVIPRFIKALANSMIVYEGTKVEMEVEVRSQQSVAFEWERDGIAITQHTERIFVTTGEMISVLHITVTSLEDQGTYTCYAISDAGEKATTTKLNVIPVATSDAEYRPLKQPEQVPEFAEEFTTDTTVEWKEQSFLNENYINQRFKNQLAVTKNKEVLAPGPTSQYFDCRISEDRSLLQQNTRKRQYQPSSPNPGTSPGTSTDYEVTSDRSLLEQTIKQRTIQLDDRKETQQPQYYEYEVSDDRSLLQHQVRKRILQSIETDKQSMTPLPTMLETLARADQMEAILPIGKSQQADNEFQSSQPTQDVLAVPQRQTIIVGRFDQEISVPIHRSSQPASLVPLISPKPNPVNVPLSKVVEQREMVTSTSTDSQKWIPFSRETFQTNSQVESTPLVHETAESDYYSPSPERAVGDYFVLANEEGKAKPTPSVAPKPLTKTPSVQEKEIPQAIDQSFEVSESYNILVSSQALKERSQMQDLETRSTSFEVSPNVEDEQLQSDVESESVDLVRETAESDYYSPSPERAEVYFYVPARTQVKLAPAGAIKATAKLEETLGATYRKFEVSEDVNILEQVIRTHTLSGPGKSLPQELPTTNRMEEGRIVESASQVKVEQFIPEYHDYQAWEDKKFLEQVRRETWPSESAKPVDIHPTVQTEKRQVSVTQSSVTETADIPFAAPHEAPELAELAYYSPLSPTTTQIKAVIPEVEAMRTSPATYLDYEITADSSFLEHVVRSHTFSRNEEVPKQKGEVVERGEINEEIKRPTAPNVAPKPILVRILSAGPERATLDYYSPVLTIGTQQNESIISNQVGPTYLEYEVTEDANPTEPAIRARSIPRGEVPVHETVVKSVEFYGRKLEMNKFFPPQPPSKTSAEATLLSQGPEKAEIDFYAPVPITLTDAVCNQLPPSYVDYEITEDKRRVDETVATRTVSRERVQLQPATAKPLPLPKPVPVPLVSSFEISEKAELDYYSSASAEPVEQNETTLSQQNALTAGDTTEQFVTSYRNFEVIEDVNLLEQKVRTQTFSREEQKTTEVKVGPSRELEEVHFTLTEIEKPKAPQPLPKPTPTTTDSNQRPEKAELGYCIPAAATPSERSDVRLSRVTTPSEATTEEQTRPTYVDYETSEDINIMEQVVRTRTFSPGDDQPIDEKPVQVIWEDLKPALSVMPKPMTPAAAEPFPEMAHLNYFEPATTLLRKLNEVSISTEVIRRPSELSEQPGPQFFDYDVAEHQSFLEQIVRKHTFEEISEPQERTRNMHEEFLLAEEYEEFLASDTGENTQPLEDVLAVEFSSKQVADTSLSKTTPTKPKSDVAITVIREQSQMVGSPNDLSIDWSTQQQVVVSTSDYDIQGPPAPSVVATEATERPTQGARYESFESDVMSDDQFYDARSDFYTSDTDKFYTPSRGSLASLAAFSVKSLDDLEEEETAPADLVERTEEEILPLEMTEHYTDVAVSAGHLQSFVTDRPTEHVSFNESNEVEIASFQPESPTYVDSTAFAAAQPAASLAQDMSAVFLSPLTEIHTQEDTQSLLSTSETMNVLTDVPEREELVLASSAMIETGKKLDILLSPLASDELAIEKEKNICPQDHLQHVEPTIMNDFSINEITPKLLPDFGILITGLVNVAPAPVEEVLASDAESVQPAKALKTKLEEQSFAEFSKSEESFQAFLQKTSVVSATETVSVVSDLIEIRSTTNDTKENATLSEETQEDNEGEELPTAVLDQQQAQTVDNEELSTNSTTVTTYTSLAFTSNQPSLISHLEDTVKSETNFNTHILNLTVEELPQTVVSCEPAVQLSTYIVASQTQPETLNDDTEESSSTHISDAATVMDVPEDEMGTIALSKQATDIAAATTILSIQQATEGPDSHFSSVHLFEQDNVLNNAKSGAMEIHSTEANVTTFVRPTSESDIGSLESTQNVSNVVPMSLEKTTGIANATETEIQELAARTQQTNIRAPTVFEQTEIESPKPWISRAENSVEDSSEFITIVNEAVKESHNILTTVEAGELVSALLVPSRLTDFNLVQPVTGLAVSTIFENLDFKEEVPPENVQVPMTVTSETASELATVTYIISDETTISMLGTTTGTVTREETIQEKLTEDIRVGEETVVTELVPMEHQSAAATAEVSSVSTTENLLLETMEDLPPYAAPMDVPSPLDTISVVALATVTDSTTLGFATVMLRSKDEENMDELELQMSQVQAVFDAAVPQEIQIQGLTTTEVVSSPDSHETIHETVEGKASNDFTADLVVSITDKVAPAQMPPQQISTVLEKISDVAVPDAITDTRSQEISFSSSEEDFVMVESSDLKLSRDDSSNLKVESNYELASVQVSEKPLPEISTAVPVTKVVKVNEELVTDLLSLGDEQEFGQEDVSHFAPVETPSSESVSYYESIQLISKFSDKPMFQIDIPEEIMKILATETAIGRMTEEQLERAIAGHTIPLVTSTEEWTIVEDVPQLRVTDYVTDINHILAPDVSVSNDHVVAIRAARDVFPIEMVVDQLSITDVKDDEPIDLKTYDVISEVDTVEAVQQYTPLESATPKEDHISELVGTPVNQRPDAEKLSSELLTVIPSETREKLTVFTESKQRTVTELSVPVLVTPLAPNLLVMDGQSMVLQCQFEVRPMKEAVWYHGDEAVLENEDITLYQDETGVCELRIAEVFPEDAGLYICRLDTEYGLIESRSQVTVEAYEYSPDSEEASISLYHTTGRSELVVERTVSKEWDSTLPDISETALGEEDASHITELPEEEIVDHREHVSAYAVISSLHGSSIQPDEWFLVPDTHVMPTTTIPFDEHSLPIPEEGMSSLVIKSSSSLANDALPALFSETWDASAMAPENLFHTLTLARELLEECNAEAVGTNNEARIKPQSDMREQAGITKVEDIAFIETVSSNSLILEANQSEPLITEVHLSDVRLPTTTLSSREIVDEKLEAITNDVYPLETSWKSEDFSADVHTINIEVEESRVIEVFDTASSSQNLLLEEFSMNMDVSAEECDVIADYHIQEFPEDEELTSEDLENLLKIAAVASIVATDSLTFETTVSFVDADDHQPLVDINLRIPEQPVSPLASKDSCVNKRQNEVLAPYQPIFSESELVWSRPTVTSVTIVDSSQKLCQVFETMSGQTSLSETSKFEEGTLTKIPLESETIQFSGEPTSGKGPVKSEAIIKMAELIELENFPDAIRKPSAETFVNNEVTPVHVRGADATDKVLPHATRHDLSASLIFKAPNDSPATESKHHLAAFSAQKVNSSHPLTGELFVKRTEDISETSTSVLAEIKDEVTKREETVSAEEQPTLLETAEAAEYHVTRLEAQPELPLQPEFATFEMAPIQLVAESTVTTVTQHEETTVREEQPALPNPPM
ncbi:Titin [Hypsibius exemplaris]|uniref:Titin n=1 Tax=Hypsibius exemplaris TaxID=2072580 RepID=A0A1W0XEW4_HYPEX|nr:Titin [Hypsibius exemplaris]